MVPSRQWWRFPAIASGLGASAVLGPAWLDPTRWVPGHPLADGAKHIWSYWHAPATLASWPWTDALNGPSGGLLLDPMALPAWLLAPLTALGGPALSANVWVWGMLFAAGLGVARLARALGATTGGATLAAALAVMGQPLLAYPVASGVHERLSVALLPWLVASMLRRARTGEGGWVPAVLLAPLALHSGVWAWVGTLLMVAGLGLRREVSVARYLRPWALGLVLLAGAFALSRGWSADPLSLAPQPGRHGLLGPGGAVVRAATPASLWWPATPAFLEEGDLLVRGEHLGLVATGLVVWGLAQWRDRRTVWWGLVLGLLLAWALGPWPLGRLNPIYALSVWVVPLLGAWPEPGQLTMPLALLLTAVVGAAWSGVSSKPGRGVLLALLVLERALALPPLAQVTDTRTDPIFDQLDAPGVVVTIPRDLPHRRLTPGVPFIAQLRHQQPIAASVFPGVSRWDDWAPVKSAQATDWLAVVRCMQRGGLRYVALRADVLGDEAASIGGAMVAAGAREVGRSESWVLVDLGASAQEPVAVPPFQPLGAAPAPTGWLPPAPLPVGVHTVERTTDTCPVDGVRRRGPPASG